MDLSPPTTLPSIPPFELTEVLGTGATSVVYRARREGDTFALKLMRSAQKDAAAAIRFRREAAAVARLSHPSLVKVVEVNEQDGVPYLVMEYVEGQSLSSLLRQGPLAEAALVKLATCLAGALAEVHRRGLVHRDIKPANIIVQPSGAAKIIDFGFVTQIESKQDGNQEIMGTFLYSAPEQTGMLRRCVDGRADLYALGAVLFECATGSPPFSAPSVPELLRKHMSERPPDAAHLNPQIRPALAQIIGKLLAKDPDDRYWTGEGLLSDLQSLAALEADRLAGRPIQLGLKDSQVLVSDVPLVGRSEEMGTLRALWGKVRHGSGGAIQVEGEGGSGKTRLIREVIALAESDGGWVLAGKAQQHERLSFGLLREALDEHLAKVARLDAPTREAAYARVRRAAGEFGGLIKRLSRPLERVLEAAPDLRPLEPVSEQLRFYEKLAEFLVNLIRESGPTVLLVDDVQWADDGTLEVLKRVASSLSETPLLIAATARNDRDSEAGRSRALAALSGAPAQRLALSPLDTPAVGELIAASLGGKPMSPELVERLAAKSNGNPFVVGEYLHALLESGMLRPTTGQWELTAESFQELALPNDVVQLLIRRVAALSPEAAHLLSTAAVIGSDVDLELLAQCSDGRADRIARMLEEGLRAGLLERQRAGFRFIHDRVHEAMLARLDEGVLKDTHQLVAEALDRRKGDQSDASLFALARHFAEGHPERNRARAYTAELQAGARALERFSNELAYALLSRARESATLMDLKAERTAALDELLGVASMRTGRLMEAREHYGRALAVSTAPEDRARIAFLVGTTYGTEGQNERAWQQGKEALAMLGVGLPRSRLLQLLSLLGHWIAAGFLAKTGWRFGRAQGAERKHREIVSSVHTASRLWVFFSKSPMLPLLQLVIRELHNVQHLGVAPETAKAHAVYAQLLGVVGKKKAAIENSELSISLARQLGSPELKAYCEGNAGTVLDFVGEVVAGQRQIAGVLQDVFRFCNSQDVVSILSHHLLSFHMQGRSREAVDLARRYLPVMVKTGSPGGQLTVWGILYSQLILLGQAAEAARARETQLSLFRQVSTQEQAISSFCVFTLIPNLDTGDFGPETQEQIRIIEGFRLDYYRRTTKLVAAYIRAEEHFRARGEAERARTLKQWRGALATYSRGPRCPVHECHYLTHMAMLASEAGRQRQALKLLDRAEDQAKLAVSPWGEWAAAQARARVLCAAKDGGANREALRAVELAEANGWKNRAQRVRAEFGLEQQLPGPSGILRTTSYDSMMSTGSRSRRLLANERLVESILQVSLASSSTIDPLEQARAALDQLVQVLGAERAALFVYRPSKGTAGPSDPGDLQLLAVRGTDNDTASLAGYSSTVVRKVATTREPVIVASIEEGEALGSESAVGHNLRSIIAAPLILHDRLLGVVYLDSAVINGLFGDDDLQILFAISNHIAIAMEAARVARAEAERIALQRDLELTSTVQSFFLPRTPQHRGAKFDLRGYYRPAGQCSGDWWWHDGGEDSLLLLMGDVTGHGAAPAMLTAAVASYLRALRTHGLSATVEELLNELHGELQTLAQSQYSMTMAAVHLVDSGRRLEVYTAGCPPLILAGGAEAPALLMSRSTPLGASGPFKVGRQTRAVSPGMRLVMCTDGVIEMSTGQERVFGLKRLIKSVQNCMGQPPGAAMDLLVASLDEARGDVPLEDDITVAMLDVT